MGAFRGEENSKKIPIRAAAKDNDGQDGRTIGDRPVGVWGGWRVRVGLTTNVSEGDCVMAEGPFSLP